MGFFFFYVQRVGSESLLLVFVPVKPRPRFPMSFVMVFFMSNELAVKGYCLFLFLWSQDLDFQCHLSWYFFYVQWVGSERLLLVFVPVKPRPRFPMSFVTVFFFFYVQRVGSESLLLVFLPVKPRPRFPMSFVMVFFMSNDLDFQCHLSWYFFMSNELAVKGYCLFLFLWSQDLDFQCHLSWYFLCPMSWQWKVIACFCSCEAKT